MSFGDRSLIMGRGVEVGGYKIGGGGKQVTFYPYKKKGEVSAMLKGGTKRFGVVLKLELESIAILKGGGSELYK